MHTNDPTVILRNVSIGYDKTTVAEGISTELHSGELTCLIGPNGVGKSTLLKTLAGFLPPLTAPDTLWISGEGELSRRISVVLTHHVEVDNMSVRQLVAMGRSPYTGFWGSLSDSDNAIIDKAMADVGVQDFARRYVNTLSDGERQKVMIAKALAQQTPVIFLDEPTAFLDYPSKVEVMQLLLRLCHTQRKTILLSTHDVEIALQLADRLWVFNEGSLTAGTVKDMAQSGALSRFLDGESIRFNPEEMRIHIGDASAGQ